MSDEVISFSQVITNTFRNISVDDVQKANAITDAWKTVVCSIKGYGNSFHGENQYEGQNLYEHTRIVDFKNGVILVEADHPGWLQLLQLHKKYILTGLKRKVPELNINNMVFKITGTKGELADVEERKSSVDKVRSSMQKKIDEQEKALENDKYADNKVEPAKNLPPELTAIFDDLKQRMLTNSKE